MPANGWWHEWTFNYDVKVEHNEVHLDLAEREAKILVFCGDHWQPPDSTLQSSPINELNKPSQEEEQESDFLKSQSSTSELFLQY